MSNIVKLLRSGMPSCPGEDSGMEWDAYLAEQWMRDAADEIERLLADKDVQRSQDRNAAYEAEIERLQAENYTRLRANKILVAENDRLRAQVAKDTGTWQDLFYGERAVNERLRAVLDAVLKGVQWDEKPGHINGLKTMVRHALENNDHT